MTWVRHRRFCDIKLGVSLRFRRLFVFQGMKRLFTAPGKETSRLKKEILLVLILGVGLKGCVRIWRLRLGLGK